MDQPASVPRGRSLSEGAPHLPVPDTEAVSTHGPRGAGHMSWAGHNPDTQAPLGVTVARKPLSWDRTDSHGCLLCLTATTSLSCLPRWLSGHNLGDRGLELCAPWQGVCPDSQNEGEKLQMVQIHHLHLPSLSQLDIPEFPSPGIVPQRKTRKQPRMPQTVSHFSKKLRLSQFFLPFPKLKCASSIACYQK